MTLQLEPTLEAQLNERAQRDGVPAEDLVISAVQKLLKSTRLALIPQDDWEEEIFSIGRNCGITHTDFELSSEGIYS